MGGGGFELALGCDLIVAGRSARFAFPEGLIGILTLQGGVYNIAERIGHAKAIELAFLSEPVSVRIVNPEMNENMEFASPSTISLLGTQRLSHVGRRRVGDL